VELDILKDEDPMPLDDALTEPAEPARPAPFRTSLRAVPRVLLRPGEFFDEEVRTGRAGGRQAAEFLVLCGLAGSVPAALLAPAKPAALFLAFFLNALLTPLVFTALLRPVTAVLCRGAFTTRDLFRIAAYAQVTLLFSWIPGAAWPAGLWKLVLIGTGLARVGRVSAGRAAAALAAVLAILLAAVRLVPFTQPL